MHFVSPIQPLLYNYTATVFMWYLVGGNNNIFMEKQDTFSHSKCKQTAMSLETVCFYFISSAWYPSLCHPGNYDANTTQWQNTKSPKAFHNYSGVIKEYRTIIVLDSLVYCNGAGKWWQAIVSYLFFMCRYRKCHRLALISTLTTLNYFCINHGDRRGFFNLKSP